MTTKRILCIEDDYQSRRLLKKLLTLNGYEPLEAEDALMGIELTTREHPDLILMDINLPGMDGMEATARLKSDAMLSVIPIIALTANAMRGDRERIMEAGCNGYLQKPVNDRELLDMLHRHIGPGTAEAMPGSTYKRG